MPPAFFVDDGGGQFGAIKLNMVYVVRCRNDDFFIGTGIVIV